MNILILSWRGPGHPDEGGAEIVTHEYAKAWVKAGHNVTLFTSSYKGSKSSEVIDGVNIVRRGDQIFGVHLAAMIWYLFGNHRMFDFVIDQFHGIPFFTPVYVRKKKAALIHEVTKDIWNLNQLSFPLNFVAAIFGKLLEPQIFKLYRKVPFITVSESTKHDLISWGIPQSNISILHNGVSVLNFNIKKAHKKTVIYLGMLTKDKGIEIALECFSYLQKKLGPNIQFWVIGKSDPKYLEYIQFKTVDLGLKNVRFWGHVTNVKKFQLLSRAHILVHPSIREGWGLVVIEAAAMGCPTIAFNVAGLRDAVINGKTGLLCNEKSAEALAKQAMELLLNEKKLGKMSKNAILWSQTFSWKKSTESSLHLLNQLTG